MKKLFAIFALISLSVAAMAQSNTGSESDSESDSYAPVNSIYASEGGVFSVGLLSRMGYGFYFVDTQDYTPQKLGSGEFSVNLVQFHFRPAEAFGVDLGTDFMVRHFNSVDEAFYQTSDGYIKAGTNVLPTGAQDIHSNFNTFGVIFPLTLNAYFGDFKVGVGAELGLNFAAETEYRYRNARRRVSVSEDKAKVNTLTYDFVAQVSYDYLGVFFKFYPKTMHILPSPSVDQSFFALGIQIGF